MNVRVTVDGREYRVDFYPRSSEVREVSTVARRQTWSGERSYNAVIFRRLRKGPTAKNQPRGKALAVIKAATSQRGAMNDGR